MKVVMGGVNDVTLDALHDQSLARCTRIQAAVAYARRGNPLFDSVRRSAPLEFFGRLDGVDPDLLDDILDDGPTRILCRLYARLHAKVVWWHGYGAYIGSANLTDSGWHRNVECGVFYAHEEMASAGLLETLPPLFQELRDAGGIAPTKAIVAELRQIGDERRKLGDGPDKKLAELGQRLGRPIHPFHVPSTFADLGLAEKILVEAREGRTEWRIPSLAWALHVVQRSKPRRQRTLQRLAKRPQGQVSQLLTIMGTLVHDNPTIIDHWLEVGWRGQLGEGTEKPVPTAAMLAIAKMTDRDARQAAYDRQCNHPRRTARGGRPERWRAILKSRGEARDGHVELEDTGGV